MRRLLWVGDAGCDSGFARATHRILDVLRKDWDVTVLGLSYRGDPHSYPYPIYPAYKFQGDFFGVKRIAEVYQACKADVIVIQQDSWNIPAYLENLRAFDPKPIVVGAVAIDGKNVRSEEFLNELDGCIFWTDFARDEALAGGLTKPSFVCPLGIDLGIYSPGDRAEARKALGWEQFVSPKTGHKVPEDAFVFLNVNRNQPRKRMDLTFEYFAEFYHTNKADNAYLYLHVAPTGDMGYNLLQLTKYFKLTNHVIVVDLGIWQGVTEKDLVNTYRAADCLITTTQGEGWGLTTMEGMACGLPCIVPNWSALGDWATAAWKVPCSYTAMTPNAMNMVGGVPSKFEFVSAMNHLYRNQQLRERMSRRGLELAAEPRYNWENVGKSFGEAIKKVYFDATLGI